MNNNIRGLIQFDSATLRDLNFPDTQKILKAVAVIEAPLNIDIAQKIKCAHLFKPTGDPIEDVGKYSPPIKLSDVDVQFPSGTNDGVDTYRPELIRSFQIIPIDDLHLSVQFRIHITGDEQAFELLATRQKYLGKKIALSIRSLQEEFNFSGEAAGTRVEMSGDKDATTIDASPLFDQGEASIEPEGEAQTAATTTKSKKTKSKPKTRPSVSPQRIGKAVTIQ